MNFEVSVIIPTYARPQKTSRAIRSVLRQAEVVTEVVVVDDASPQPFVLPEDLRDRVRLVRLHGNVGPAGARNAGVSAASAAFLGFLDSDDFYLPNTLAGRLKILRERAENSFPTLLASTVWRWTPGRAVQEFRPLETNQLGDFASGCWYFPGSTSLMSRGTWEAVGALDARVRRLEDLDWGVRLGLAGGRLSVTDQPAAVIERSSPAPLATVTAATDVLLRLYGKGGPRRLGKSELSRLLAYLELEKARSALSEGRFATFATNMLRSLAHQPRITLHQRQWWVSRKGTASELAAIEDFAESLQRTD
jgi:glycosyltransferase involved in cell wall biosynthesis